jgi:hypothetical protein
VLLVTAQVKVETDADTDAVGAVKSVVTIADADAVQPFIISVTMSVYVPPFVAEIELAFEPVLQLYDNATPELATNVALGL